MASLNAHSILLPRLGAGNLPYLRGSSFESVHALENLSRDPEQEYFADGMTDELTGLSQYFPKAIAGSIRCAPTPGFRKRCAGSGFRGRERVDTLEKTAGIPRLAPRSRARTWGTNTRLSPAYRRQTLPVF